MTRLNDLLEDEFDSPEAQLALELAREDQKLLGELVAIRRRRGLSQEDVAATLGLSQATVSAFERLGNDPHLSTVRRYARALNVMVRHHLDESPTDCQDSHFLSHVGDTGVHTVDTATAVARQIARQGAPAWPSSSTAAKVLESVDS